MDGEGNIKSRGGRLELHLDECDVRVDYRGDKRGIMEKGSKR